MILPTVNPGTFTGVPTLEVPGGRNYVFRGGKGFKFARYTGEEIEPETMVTDGGSVPREFWNLPGLNPWDYMPAFLIHDWMYTVHHCTQSNYTFELANLILAEGILTLMTSGMVPHDRPALEAIYAAVTIFGRRVWDAPHDAAWCKATLPESNL